MTQSPQTARCCGTAVQVVALSGGDEHSAVQLVRCAGCGLSTWVLDGVEVDKSDALGALSKAFAPAAPHPRHVPVRHRAAAPAAPPPPQDELSGLLAGWQVHGVAR
jgi:hypothetical protein